MAKKDRFTHYAYYPLFGFNVPCYWDEESDNIEGRNWLYDKLLDFAIWIDFEFGEGFRFWVGGRIHD